ncbi:MAG: MBL fold metallo-hydrolase [Verrucomicrobiales bacterium]|nr:MBL fold metallo-hydrolase [Verrucomicrobiales bacterium]
MNPPFLADEAFLEDVARARATGASKTAASTLDLWWLGQSGFLVHHRGAFLLLDPYLSDSLTRKYAGTDKPHVRMTGRVVDPARLDFVSAVTSSHNHTDHLDPETLRPLVQANPGLVLFCPEANRTTVRERSGLPDERILGMDVPSTAPANVGPRQPVPGTPFALTPVPAAHETLDRDAQGRLVYLGFVLHVGPFRIYHSGDTVRFDGMAEALRPFDVDIALLPINGRAPERRVAGNLWGPEAARLARDIGARLAVPCHYDMFEFNTATPDAFVASCIAMGQARRVLRQGERLTWAPAP